MRLALAIGALACSTALGDEEISTYGHMHGYAIGWEAVGQTFVVPPSNLLDSVAFTLKGTGDADTAFSVSLLTWDAADLTWHDEIHIGSDSIAPGLIKTFSFDVDRLLPAGADYVLMVAFPNENEPTPSVATVFDAYEHGALVTRQLDDVILTPAYDMLFSAQFKSCHADFNGDGSLDIMDFLSFESAFFAGHAGADCSNDGVFDILDFVCFQQQFIQGCGS